MHRYGMEQINSGLQSGVCLRQSPKKHTVGLDKAISPSETIRNIKKVFQRIELELVRDITRIDAGRLDKAIQKFRLSIEQHPMSALHCTLEIANCLKHMQCWEEAIDAYKKALYYKPDRAMQYRILNALALCSDRLKESKGIPAAPSEQ